MMMSLTNGVLSVRCHRLNAVSIAQSFRHGMKTGVTGPRSTGRLYPRPMHSYSRAISAIPFQAHTFGLGLRHVHNCFPLRQIVGKGRETRLILEHEYSIQKDTLLYRYDNKRFFKLLNLAAMSQFFFWSYLSHFAFTMMRDIPISEKDKNDPNVPWWKKMNFGKLRNGIALGCFMIGWGTMAIGWMYTLRCVRYLVLKKGGENLVFVTFTPFSRNKSLIVPLKQVSAKQSRMSSMVYLPMKVKGKSFHYMLDMRGEFLNTKLFDYSAGLQRNWTK